MPLIILSGAGLGYTLCGAVMTGKDRVDAAVELFEENCLTLVTSPGAHPAPEIPRIEKIPGYDLWGDPASQFVLYRDRRECSITDTMKALSEEDRQRFDAKMAALIEERLPMLDPDQNYSTALGSWDMAKFWAIYEFGDQRRWGVALNRPGKGGGDEDTSVVLFLPGSSEV